MKLYSIVVYTICHLIVIVSNEVNVETIEASKTLLWGPGLKPEEIVMRARYFFLQLRDANGNNSTISPGKEIVSVIIEGETITKSFCHIWKQVLDRNDGSFIVRYKLDRTCFNIKISVKVNDDDVPGSPFFFNGPVYEEECYCPNRNVNDWLDKFQCRLNYAQIDSDLREFVSVDFEKELRNEIVKRYDRPNSVSICHYVVKENKIYRRCYGQHVGFKIFMDGILLSLARKVFLPDMELFVNLGDWPLVSSNDKTYPIFSWCGSNDTKDIVMPTYDITVATLENMGRVMLDMLSVQANSRLAWSDKIEKAFWKGRDSSRERLDLVELSRKHPDLINASITNFFFYKNEIDKYGPRQNHTSFFHFFDYKYQLNIDGTVAAYRFPYLLAGDSIVLKQDSKYYEFFYKDLNEYEHYLPIEKNLNDLVDKIIWAKENDDTVYQISRRGQLYARENLMPRDIFCYHAVLFKEWSNRIKSKIVILDDMDEVPQPENTCKCDRNLNDFTNTKEEL